MFFILEEKEGDGQENETQGPAVLVEALGVNVDYDYCDDYHYDESENESWGVVVDGGDDDFEDERKRKDEN